MFCTILLKLVRVSLGYLTVVFPSVRVERGVPCKPSGRRNLGNTGTTPNMGSRSKALAPPEQVGDLISFDGDAGDKEDNGNANSQEGKEPSFDGNLMGLLDTSQGSVNKIDQMIEANLSGFSGQEECRSLTVSTCSVVSRRRLHGDNKVHRA
uniref:Uncharacterized protein n=1 Tax=Arundo donax TaxID=35708 RepID=A0A0A9GP62_ARUDO